MGPQGAPGPDSDFAAYAALLATLSSLEAQMDTFETSLSASETRLAAMIERPQTLLNAMSKISLSGMAASCSALPLVSSTGDYWIDTDDSGPALPLMLHCDFGTTGGPYGWARVNDPSTLTSNAADYTTVCARYGMKIVRPRNQQEALAITTQLADIPTIVNIRYNAGVLSCGDGTAPCDYFLGDPSCLPSTGSGLLFSNGIATASCPLGTFSTTATAGRQGWVVCEP